MSNVAQLLIIGGSAGSLNMVRRILSSLRLDMDIAVVVVLHRKNSNDTILVELLGQATSFLVKEAEEKEAIKPRTVYIAPADYHLLIERDHTLSLDDSEKVNFSRPSIDVSFESAADAFSRDVAGILLSGANADGVSGLKAIKTRGGLVVVQNPLSADVSYMPQQAINQVAVDIIINDNDVDTLVDRIRGGHA